MTDLIKKLSSDQEDFNILMGGALKHTQNITYVITHYSNKLTQSSYNQLAKPLSMCLKITDYTKKICKNMITAIPRVMVRDYLMTHIKCSNHVQNMMYIHCQRMDNGDKAFNPLVQKTIALTNDLKYHADNVSILTTDAKSLDKTIGNTKELLAIKDVF